MLQRTLRRVDQIFRFGGEEFVILLPGLDQARALRAGASAISLLDLPAWAALAVKNPNTIINITQTMARTNDCSRYTIQAENRIKPV